MGVLDLVQERLHSTRPGDFEITFMKAVDSETKEGPRVEGEIGGGLGGALLWIPRSIMGKK